MHRLINGQLEVVFSFFFCFCIRDLLICNSVFFLSRMASNIERSVQDKTNFKSVGKIKVNNTCMSARYEPSFHGLKKGFITFL